MVIDSILAEINRSAEEAPWLSLETHNPVLETILADTISAVQQGDGRQYAFFHRLWAALNKRRYGLEKPLGSRFELMLNGLALRLEEAWLGQERQRVADRLARIPTEPEAFMAWFEALEQTGYGQGHSLFTYLAERASKGDMRYFIHQEMATEAGFDDLIAMTQVKTPLTVKMELAHNYWDEMGDGEPDQVHGHLLQGLAKTFGLSWHPYYADVHWAPLALSNTMLAFAGRRSHFYQSIGALGVIELTAPGRCVQVLRGLQRLEFSEEDSQYYALHSELDRTHWEGWKQGVMLPLLRENPDCAQAMAEGALIRLLGGNRCFEVYFRQLGMSQIPLQAEEEAFALV